MRHAGINEFEREIITQSMLQFCASLDKEPFGRIDEDGRIFYEFKIPLVFRSFSILFVVSGIDAYAVSFEEIE